ncbi:MAG: hypothetical protein ACR2MG_12595 [Pyrinomonadaceae bacterium]
MKQFLKYRSLTIFLLIAVFIIAITFTSIQSQQNKFQISEDVNLENKVELLVVESITQMPKSENILRSVEAEKSSTETSNRKDFEIRLRNDYQKPIVLYALRIDEKPKDKGKILDINEVIRGGLLDDWSLQPGKTDLNFFGTTGKEKTTVTIAAALFEDGTGVGDPDELERLRRDVAGYKLAYQRAAQTLRQNLYQSQLSKSDSGSDSLEQQISEIKNQSVPMNQVFSSSYKSAVTTVAGEIKEIKMRMKSDPNLTYESGITAELARIERLLVKMEPFQ